MSEKTIDYILVGDNQSIPLFLRLLFLATYSKTYLIILTNQQLELLSL